MFDKLIKEVEGLKDLQFPSLKESTHSNNKKNWRLQEKRLLRIRGLLAKKISERLLRTCTAAQATTKTTSKSTLDNWLSTNWPRYTLTRACMTRVSTCWTSCKSKVLRTIYGLECHTPGCTLRFWGEETTLKGRSMWLEKDLMSLKTMSIKLYLKISNK